MPENDITNDIMNRIDSLQQKPKWYFILRNIGFFVCIIVLIVLGSVSLGSFWIDVQELQLLVFESGLEWTSFFSQAMFELVLLATVGIAVAYLVYRQTDWFLVRHKGILITGFSIFILLGGFFYTFVYTFVARNTMMQRNLVENSMIRPNRRQMLDDRLHARGVYTGVIENIDPISITILGTSGRKTFQINRRISDLENLHRGDRVIVRIDPQNTIKAIKLMN
jgi:hypothetical protein